jgi:hypothetical protein
MDDDPPGSTCAIFFPQMRFAISLRKISRSQAAKHPNKIKLKQQFT